MNSIAQQPADTFSSPAQPLPWSTKIQYAHLRVSDLHQAMRFYRDLLGLVETDSAGETVTLSASTSQEPILLLTEDHSAKARYNRTPGLFHLAMLYPTRKALARIFRLLHLRRWPFQGFAHHGVSEALYLADPDGNGIELYRDLPREAWPYKDGELQMTTAQLDLEDLLSELDGTSDGEPMTSQGLSIGHIHLQVSDLQRAEDFYHKVLGFDVIQRNFPGALFMSAGSYHHHIGANVWNSRGSAPATDARLGLIEFGISLGDGHSRRNLANRLQLTSHWISGSDAHSVLRDHDDIRIELS